MAGSSAGIMSAAAHPAAMAAASASAAAAPQAGPSGSSMAAPVGRRSAIDRIDLRRPITLTFRYKHRTREEGETESHEVTVRAEGGGFGVNSFDTARVWVIRACLHFGLVNLARKLCPVDRLEHIRLSPELPVEQGCCLVYGPFANLSTLDCPPDFTTQMREALSQVERTRTGAAVVQKLRMAGEVVHVVHSSGKFNIRNKQRPEQHAMMYADFSTLAGQTYRGIIPGGNAYSVGTFPLEPFIAVCHELIHAVHDKEDLAAAAGRTSTQSPMPWSNQEEELTIKAWICRGPTAASASSTPASAAPASASAAPASASAPAGDDGGAARPGAGVAIAPTHPYSECHLLMELRKPIRYGHKHSGGKDVLTAQEMDEIYGPDWEARYRNET